MLAFLALNERPVLRSHVAATLWLDSTEARAAGRFRTALWRLQLPGHPLVDLHAGCVAIAQGLSVDVRRLEGLSRDLADLQHTLDDRAVRECWIAGQMVAARA